MIAEASCHPRTISGFIASFVASIAVLAVLLCAAAHADHFDDTMVQVRLLSNSANVRLLPFGRTTHGRPIPAFVISDFSTDAACKARVLVVSGQHGDEYNPVKAVVTLSRELANGSRPDLLQQCLFIMVPVANPDGISAGVRTNSSGADINRDWLDCSTTETQFIRSIVRAWRPQVMIDAHEWIGPSPVPGNGLELPECNSSSQRVAMDAMARKLAHATGLHLIRDTDKSDPRLLHRTFAAAGYAAYLLETAPDDSYAVKSSAYRTAVIEAAESLVADPELCSRLSPSSEAFSAANVAAYLESLPTGPFADPSSATIALVAMAAAVYCLVMWIMKPLANKREGAWSRKFRRCTIEWESDEHPMLKRRSLQPLTSRSWSHRRLRQRYADEERTADASRTGVVVMDAADH